MLGTALACGLFNLGILILVASYTIIFLRVPIYHPYCIYLVYHFLGFVVRPLSIYQNESSFLWKRIGFIPFPEDLFRTTLVSSVALLSVTAGLIYSCRNRPIAQIPPTSLRVGNWNGFFLALLFLSALGYYANYRSFYGAGLDSVLAYSTALDSAGGQQLVGISGYTTALAEALPILCVVLFLIPRLRLFSIAFILAFVGFRFFAGAQRLSFVVVIVAIFLILHINSGYRYPRALPLMGIALFAFAFDVIGNDRYAFRELVYGTNSASRIIDDYRQNRGDNALTSDIVEFDVATAAMSAVAVHHDYSYGTQYLRILIWPIPRQIWPNKPVITSIVDFNKYGDFSYLSRSLYADVYMNIGFTLIPIAMFLLGMFFGKVYTVARETRSATAFLFFWVVIMYTKTILRDGGVTFLYFWIFSMLSVYVIVKAGQMTISRTPLRAPSARREMVGKVARA